MNLVNRMLRGLLVFTALFLTCISLSADWLFDRGGLSERFNDCITLLEAQSKSEQLAIESDATFKRLLVKSRIAEALRNKEMTLIDAAVYFRALHEDPKSWHYPNRPRPERKDGEGWCRFVIQWTVQNSYFNHSSSQTEVLQQHLEKELQKQLARHSTLILPE